MRMLIKKKKAAYDKIYRQENKDKLREQKRTWERNSLDIEFVAILNAE